MRAAIACIAIAGAAATARAQPVPDVPQPERLDEPPRPTTLVCMPCERARARLAELGEHGQVLEAAAPELAALQRLHIEGDSISQAQLAGLFQVASEDTRVALDAYAMRFGSSMALRDLAALACKAPASPCVDQVFAALRCTRGMCQVVQEQDRDYAHPERGCDPYVRHVRSSAGGGGVELISGWHDAAAPSDGRGWGYGLEARRRFTNRFGLVARIDHTRGRDAGEDLDGDGRDDVPTGPIHRWSAMIGPSIVLTATHAGELARYWQLDVLAGGLTTRTQAGEDGFVAGADLSYQAAVVRLGLRALHGIGDTRDARAVLAHAGITIGAAPVLSYGAGCGHNERPLGSAWALGVDIPLSGYALGTDLGYLAPGFGFEAAYHLQPRLDPLVRADLLVFTNGAADRVLHQTLLAGARFDLSPENARGSRVGTFVSLLAGYAFAAVTEPSNAGAGPVMDVSIGWGGQGTDGAGWLRLHGRFGLTPDNSDLRAVFLSAGLEVRLDRRRWSDRD